MNRTLSLAEDVIVDDTTDFSPSYSDKVLTAERDDPEKIASEHELNGHEEDSPQDASDWPQHVYEQNKRCHKIKADDKKTAKQQWKYAVSATADPNGNTVVELNGTNPGGHVLVLADPSGLKEPTPI